MSAVEYWSSPCGATLTGYEVGVAMRENRVEILVQGIYPAVEHGPLFYGECLARIRDERGLLYTASQFIPALENCDTMTVFDRHVLQLVFDHLDQDATVTLGCNISVANLVDPREWSNLWKLVLDNVHLTQRLVLELTENCACTDVDAARQAINFLRDVGCRIAIDDFGAAYADPRRLCELPHDIVKIDGFFIKKLSEMSVDKRFLRSLVRLSTSSSSSVVIEGIETLEHYRIARAAGASFVQGFFCSGVVGFAELPKVLMPSNCSGQSIPLAVHPNVSF